MTSRPAASPAAGLSRLSAARPHRSWRGAHSSRAAGYGAGCGVAASARRRASVTPPRAAGGDRTRGPAPGQRCTPCVPATYKGLAKDRRRRPHYHYSKIWVLILFYVLLFLILNLYFESVFRNLPPWCLVACTKDETSIGIFLITCLVSTVEVQYFDFG